MLRFVKNNWKKDEDFFLNSFKGKFFAVSSLQDRPKKPELVRITEQSCERTKENAMGPRIEGKEAKTYYITYSNLIAWRRFPPKYVENTFYAIQSTFRSLEMHSKWRY